ncbi:Uncharacterised protein [Acinetobacter baumannii]|nr:Uncharacterised protein [Acinetobacter baumannii]
MATLLPQGRLFEDPAGHSLLIAGAQQHAHVGLFVIENLFFILVVRYPADIDSGPAEHGGYRALPEAPRDTGVQGGGEIAVVVANLALFHGVEGIPATGATESLHYLFSLSALLEGRGHTLVDQLLSRIQLLPLTQSAIQVRVVNAGVETKRHHFGVTVDATRLSAQVLFRIRPEPLHQAIRQRLVGRYSADLALYRLAQQCDLAHYLMQLVGDFAPQFRACVEHQLTRGTAGGAPLLQRDPADAPFEQAASLDTGLLDLAAGTNAGQGGAQRTQRPISAGQAGVLPGQSFRCQGRQLARLVESLQGHGQCLLQHHLLEHDGRGHDRRLRVLTGLRAGAGVGAQQFAQPVHDRHEGTHECRAQASEQPLTLRRVLALGQLLRFTGGGDLAGLNLSQTPTGGLVQFDGERRTLLERLNMHDGCLLLMFLRQSRNGKPHRLSGLAAVFSLESAAAKPKKREPRLTVSPCWHCSNGCLQ